MAGQSRDGSFRALLRLPSSAGHCLVSDEFALDSDDRQLVARYTTGDGNGYFGWSYVGGRDAAALGRVFVERWPSLAAASRRLDQAYVNWSRSAQAAVPT